MRKLISTGLALALTLGGAALASAQSTTLPPQASATARAHVRGHGRKGARGKFRKQLLKGIKLSDAQKAQLKTQAQAYRTQNASAIKARREQMKADFTAMKNARAAKDSSAIAAARAKLQADRQANAGVREQRIAAFRAVLTPAQQQQFDQNLAAMKTRMQQRAAKRGQGKGWKKGE